MQKITPRWWGHRAGAIFTALFAITAALAAPATAADPAWQLAQAPGKPAVPPRVEKLTLLLDFTPAPGTHTVLFVANEKGFFREAGLEVDIQPGTGSANTVTLVGAGRAPIGFADAGAVSLGVAAGAPVTMVAMVNQKTLVTFYSLKPKNITRPKDLEGKTIGFMAGAAEAKLFPAFARKNNVDLSKVKIVDLSFPTRYPSLINGNVDALGAFIVETPNIQAAAGGDVNMLKASDHGVDSYGNGFIVNNDFAAKNPQIVERFVQAAMRSLDYMIKNRNEALQISLKVAPNFTREAADARISLILPTFESNATRKNGLGSMEDAIWKETQDIMVRYGGQAKAVELNRLYTNKYLKRAGR
jgi:NitT/TauT family transport system substrate-binding protein